MSAINKNNEQWRWGLVLKRREGGVSKEWTPFRPRAVLQDLLLQIMRLIGSALHYTAVVYVFGTLGRCTVYSVTRIERGHRSLFIHVRVYYFAYFVNNVRTQTTPIQQIAHMHMRACIHNKICTCTVITRTRYKLQARVFRPLCAPNNSVIITRAFYRRCSRGARIMTGWQQYIKIYILYYYTPFFHCDDIEFERRDRLWTGPYVTENV